MVTSYLCDIQGGENLKARRTECLGRYQTKGLNANLSYLLLLTYVPTIDISTVDHNSKQATYGS